MRTFDELNAMRLRRSDPGWGEWIRERERARLREQPESQEEWWQSALRSVCEAPEDDWEIGVRAVQSLEILLGWCDDLVIDRVEEEAAHNERLRRSLTGIWQAGMSDAVWERVQVIVRSVPNPLRPGKGPKPKANDC
jgi:hypothetical protein